ncbi:MAG: CoA transferase, partial [Myxococcota bacterium]|nr:CoA transferase [Myxococcota bacterium]
MEEAKPAALAGRRVVELCDESGMYCGKLLADLGADVLRVEPPGGDPLRGIPPQPDGVANSPMGLRFRYLNTNKRTQCLDLADADGAEAFKQLVASADLVLETMAPGRLDALGLGYEALKTINPAIVVVSMSGFGQTGPHRDYVASDLVTNAVGGALYVTGDPEDPPVNLAGDQAHMMTSSCAAASSLIALRQRDETGQGQHVDISAQEVMLAVTHISGVGKYLDDDVIPVRNGTSLFAAVPSGAYACKDGLIYLIVNRPLHWEALAKWIHEETGNEEVIDPMFEGPSSVRIEYRELLDIFIGDMTCQYTVDEIYHEGQRRHIAMTPVSSSAQVVADPHLAARKFFVDVPQADGGRLVMPGAPYRFDATPWRIDKPAPLFEADNEKGFEPRADRQPATAATSVAFPVEHQALADLRVVEFTAGMAGPWIG